MHGIAGGAGVEGGREIGVEGGAAQLGEESESGAAQPGDARSTRSGAAGSRRAESWSLHR